MGSNQPKVRSKQLWDSRTGSSSLRTFCQQQRMWPRWMGGAAAHIGSQCWSGWRRSRPVTGCHVSRMTLLTTHDSCWSPYQRTFISSFYQNLGLSPGDLRDLQLSACGRSCRQFQELHGQTWILEETLRGIGKGSWDDQEWSQAQFIGKGRGGCEEWRWNWRDCGAPILDFIAFVSNNLLWLLTVVGQVYSRLIIDVSGVILCSLNIIYKSLLTTIWIEYSIFLPFFLLCNFCFYVSSLLPYSQTIFPNPFYQTTTCFFLNFLRRTGHHKQKQNKTHAT